MSARSWRLHFLFNGLPLITGVVLPELGADATLGAAGAAAAGGCTRA